MLGNFYLGTYGIVPGHSLIHYQKSGVLMFNQQKFIWKMV